MKLLPINMNTTTQPTKPLVKWMKKIGLSGFIFFLVKGLLWLALGYWFVQ